MSSTHIYKRPLRFLAAAIFTVLLSGLLSARLVAVEVGGGGASSRDFNTLADGHRVIEEVSAPPRGLILDRTGRVLA